MANTGKTVRLDTPEKEYESIEDRMSKVIATINVHRRELVRRAKNATTQEDILYLNGQIAEHQFFIDTLSVAGLINPI